MLYFLVLLKGVLFFRISDRMITKQNRWDSRISRKNQLVPDVDLIKLCYIILTTMTMIFIKSIRTVRIAVANGIGVYTER